MSKWIYVLDGCIIGLYGGLITSYFDDSKPTLWIVALCSMGILIQLAVIRYLRKD